MTYILGFKSKKCVYLTGDFAITKEGTDLSLREEYSSFGEKHIIRGANGNKSFTVEESMLKIFPVSSNVAVGFAGDVRFAVSIIENFSLLIDIEPPSSVQKIIEIFKSSIQSSTPSQSSAHFIIGGIVNQSPFLFAVDSNSMAVQKNSEFIHLGSLMDTGIPLSIENIISPFLKSNDVDKEILICANAVIQSSLLHYGTIQKGVGGLFLGIQISESGIRWQKDTSYILYDSGFTNPTMINMAVRDNIVAVSSPYSQEGKRFFATSTVKVNLSDWWTKWSIPIHKILNDSLMDYYVFLSTEYMLIVLVRQIKNLNNELLHVEKTEVKNTISFKLSPEVQEALSLRPKVQTATDGSSPVLLRWF